MGGLALPEIKVPEGYDAHSFLEQLAFEGAEERYGSPLPSRVSQRLAYELSVIKNTGYSGYFLIVKEIVDFVRKEFPRV